MIRVLDASVLIKAYVPELGSEMAATLLARLESGEIQLLVPDLIFPETGNILWKRYRRQELTAEEAREIAEAITALPLHIEPTAPLMPLALDIALVTGVTVYDAVYVALAKVYETRMVTADEKLVAKFAGTEWEGSVEGLSC